MLNYGCHVGIRGTPINVEHLYRHVKEDEFNKIL